MAKLELRNVTKRFGDIIALNAMSFTVDAGEFFVVVGPNGSGKTTLLRVIAGLVEPDSGEVYIDGVKVNEGAEESGEESEKMKKRRHPQERSRASASSSTWSAASPSPLASTYQNGKDGSSRLRKV